jgi:hypothetical protein
MRTGLIRSLLVVVVSVAPIGAQERFSFFHASTPESVARMLALANLLPGRRRRRSRR